MKHVFLSLSILACILFITGCSPEQQSRPYVNYAENYEIEDEFTKALYSSVSITITDIQEATSSGTVNVVVPDLKKIYMEHRDEFQENPTDQQIRKILIDNLQEFSIEKSFDAELYQEDNMWNVTSTEQINGILADVVDDYLSAVLLDTELTNITIDINMEDMWK